jgi:hypothetical protein
VSREKLTDMREITPYVCAPAASCSRLAIILSYSGVSGCVDTVRLITAN